MYQVAPHIRFREARERAGLSRDQIASQSNIHIGEEAIWDIETHEDELSSCYLASEIRKLCGLIGIHPTELFGERISEAPISAHDLVVLIGNECALRGLTVEQFEDIVGWRLRECIDPLEKLLEDMTVDGLKWLCRELRVEWRRVL